MTMMKPPSKLLLCLTFLIQLCSTSASVVASPEPPVDDSSSTSTSPSGNNYCSASLVQEYDSSRHEPHYTVGVLAIRGQDKAYSEWNNTFANYLTATAGRRFHPPITFSMKPLSLGSLFEEHHSVDFIYVNPSAYSCIASEYGAQSLVSQISRRNVAGQQYDLIKFGGVIATLANSTKNIHKLEDLKDKIVATASISGLGSGQMQFREMQKAGLSYINDPKQIVFTSNQGKIVKGLLDGQFDVGFIRTDQLERSKTNDDEDLETFLKRFKIINPQPQQTLENGMVFPFESSTPLYPEWNVASLMHVDEGVSRAVQESLTALAEHAKVGKAYQDCTDEYGPDFCQDLPFPGQFALQSQTRSDTTLEIAQLAYTAMVSGKYAGWRTTLDYMMLRSMQEGTGFLRLDEESHQWRCVRSKELYNAITCPDGYFRKTKQQVEEGCSSAGLDCPEGMQCVCQPCLKGYDVDVFPIQQEDDEEGEEKVGQGCAKMSLCGATRQTKPITFRAVDNLKREDVEITVLLHEGQESREIVVKAALDANYTYEFTLSAQLVGVMTLEIFADKQQIPESPLRVLVEDRACEEEFGGQYEPTSSGECVCKGSYVDVGGTCVPYSVLLPSIIVPLCALVVAASYWYAIKKQQEADAIWCVDPKDLSFTEPRVVLGQGTFGEVILGEYHGCNVAIKRVLPPRRTARKPTASGSGDSGAHEVLEPVDVENGGCDDGCNHAPSAHFLESGTVSTDSLAIEQSSVVEPNKDTKASFGLISAYQVGKESNMYLRTEVTTKGSIYSKSRRSRSTRDSSWLGATKGTHSKLRQDFIKEMRLLSTLRHPCITTVMGAVIDPRQEPMLVLEYCEHGSLYDLLHNETMHIEGELLLPILRDLANGIRFLHSSSPCIVHGDLKSSNVLVTSGFRAKVSDFGLSQKAKNARAMGTPYFMAPELLRGEAQASPSTDMYSVGIILYELYARKDPYEGEDSRQVLTKVCDPQISLRPPIPPGCPKEVSQLMKACWSGSPKKRPTAEALDERLKLFHVGNVQPGAMPLSHLIKPEEQPKTISNQDFLYKVFPKRVAESLVRGDKIEPESHECVTIFFSDIVGFTTISSTCSPLKVSDMLDRLYVALDALTSKHGLFKVETIGDAFMAVSNLIEDQSWDHVKRVAEFALEAVHVASEIPVDVDDPAKGFVEIRCGFHSGPVVSNVVGSLNPRFGLFGDSVNVASRMESTSHPGRVHCSTKSAELLMKQAPNIPLRKRGEIEVKGKGLMATYFVGSKGQRQRQRAASAEV